MIKRSYLRSGRRWLRCFNEGPADYVLNLDCSKIYASFVRVFLRRGFGDPLSFTFISFNVFSDEWARGLAFLVVWQTITT